MYIRACTAFVSMASLLLLSAACGDGARTNGDGNGGADVSVDAGDVGDTGGADTTDDGRDGADAVDTGQTQPPGAPVPSISYDVKQIHLDWNPVSRATYYRLLEKPDASSSFTQVGSDLQQTEAAVDVAVHLHDWAGARYALEACNAAGCSRSTEYSASKGAIEAIGYFKASNAESNDEFGGSVAVSGDGEWLAVGAPAESSGATGVGGAQDDNSVSRSGAVYVFRRSSAGWSQHAYVKASNPDDGELFGNDGIALSRHGETLAVAATREDSAADGVGGDQTDDTERDSGAVYLFDRSNDTWSQQAYVKASNSEEFDFFGSALALSGDAKTLVVSASSEDSAATGIGGDETDNSASRAGAVYVFDRGSGGWAQSAYVKASNAESGDLFGLALALSADGTTLAVGAPREGSLATGIDGDQGSNAAPDAGAVYVFDRGSGGWTQAAYVKASNTDAGDGFGNSVGLSRDGSTMAVGARSEAGGSHGVGGDPSDDSAANSGAVYVFESGGGWSQEAYLKASYGTGGEFGFQVALASDGETVAAVSRGDSSSAKGVDPGSPDQSAPNAGAVHVFVRESAGWSHRSVVKASNTEADDRYGWGGLGLSGDGETLGVGAPSEDGASTGVGGDQGDNAASGAGAVYVY